MIRQLEVAQKQLEMCDIKLSEMSSLNSELSGQVNEVRDEIAKLLAQEVGKKEMWG